MIVFFMVSIGIYNELEETTLVDKAKGGDESAFKELYDRNFERIFLLIARVSGGNIDIEDAVQDVFLIAYKKLPDFEGKAMFSTWLYRIAINIAKSHRHKKILSLLRHEKTPIEDLPLQSATPNPAEYLEARANEQKVRRVLARISEKKRRVLVLFELEGFSGPEVAEIIGCPIATVWTRLHYARENFARLLRQDEILEQNRSKE